jgi:hypothetical protein
MANQKSGIHNVELSNGSLAPIMVPNDTVDGDGFYVSYNRRDSGIYGSDTTALVVGQMQHFYILNGNHMADYLPLIDEGLDACLDYFEANIDLINKHSDRDPERLPSAGMR